MPLEVEAISHDLSPQISLICTSNSRRAKKRQQQEVSTAMQYQLTSLWYICFEMSLFTAVKLINIVVLYLDTRCHFAEQSRSIKCIEKPSRTQYMYLAGVSVLDVSGHSGYILHSWTHKIPGRLIISKTTGSCATTCHADLTDLVRSAKLHLVSRYRTTTFLSLIAVKMPRHFKTNIPERS